VNDVTSDSASCFYEVSSSIILLRDFLAKVAKNLWEMRKKVGLIAPSLQPIVPFAILIRKSPSEVLEHQKISKRNAAFSWLASSHRSASRDSLYRTSQIFYALLV